MEQRLQDIIDAVAAADEGDGVVLLADMFGGTPSNLAISVLDKGQVEVIAGINLPMLIKLTGLRSSATLSEAVTQAQLAGRKYINVARSEEHTSELQSLMRISYAVFCLKKKTPTLEDHQNTSKQHSTINTYTNTYTHTTITQQ